MMLAISLNPLDWITDATGAVASATVGSLLDSITTWVTDALTYVGQQVGTAIGEQASFRWTPGAEKYGAVFRWVALATMVGALMASAGGMALGRGGVVESLQEIPITLVLMAAWFALWDRWFAITTAMTGYFAGDAVTEQLKSGITLDIGIASFVRMLVAFLLLVCLLILLVELIVLQHVATLGLIIGQVTIGLRPIRGLRAVNGRAICNIVSVSLMPVLAMASLGLAMRNATGEAMPLTDAIVGLAGMALSCFMPMLASRFIPLGGDGSNPARAMLGSAALAGRTLGIGGVIAAGTAGSYVSHLTSGPSPATAATSTQPVSSPGRANAARATKRAGDSPSTDGARFAAQQDHRAGETPGLTAVSAPGAKNSAHSDIEPRSHHGGRRDAGASPDRDAEAAGHRLHGAPADPPRWEAPRLPIDWNESSPSGQPESSTPKASDQLARLTTDDCSSTETDNESRS